jgi:hypothetical protein
MTTATIEQTDGGFAPGATLLPADRDLSGAVEHRIAHRLERLLELGSGWDGEDAERLDPDALVTAARVIAQAISAGLPEPELFPVPDGGVQIEWAAGPVELELEIEPGQRGVVFVCDDEQTGQQIDGELPRDRSRLALAFARLAAYA